MSSANFAARSSSARPSSRGSAEEEEARWLLGDGNGDCGALLQDDPTEVVDAVEYSIFLAALGPRRVGTEWRRSCCEPGEQLS